MKRNTVVLSAIFFAVVGTAAAQGSLPPGKLAIYYGFPSKVNGSAGDLDAAAAVFNDYDIVLFGDGLQYPQYIGAEGQVPDYGCGQNSHRDHDNTVGIISRLNSTGTAVYGYVSIGDENTAWHCDTNGDGDVEPAPHTMTEIESRVDAWAAMGVAGIFLDEAEYGFGCSRTRQSDAVDYVHSKGLSAFINAWNPDEVFGADVVNKITYYTGYLGTPPAGPSLSTVEMNPTGAGTHLGADDIYLMEHFQIISGSYRDPGDWAIRSDKALTYKTQYDTRVATVTTPTPDKVFDSIDQAKLSYAWWSTLLYGFDYMGWGEANDFSSWGPYADKLLDHTRPDPGQIGSAFTADVIHNPLVHTRTTTAGTIEVIADTTNGVYTGAFFTSTPGPYVWPISKTATPDFPLSSTFGPRQKASEDYRYDFHRGIDIPADCGHPVYAIADGEVRLAGDYSYYSDRMVQIRHNKPGGGYYYSNYIHLSAIAVDEVPQENVPGPGNGQPVNKGNLIGYSGETGIGDSGVCQPGYDPPANGFDHLHFEIRDGGIRQKHCIHPLGVLPYTDAGAPQLTLNSVLYPAEPIVDVTVELPPEELDLNRVEVVIYDDSSGSLVEVDRHAYDMNEWNYLYTPYIPDVGSDLSLLDDPNYNGVQVHPARFNASSQSYVVDFTFYDLSGVARASDLVVTARATDIHGDPTEVTQGEWAWGDPTPPPAGAATLFTLVSPCDLVSINTETGVVIPIGSMGHAAEDFSFSADGRLFAAADIGRCWPHGSAEDLITVDTETGVGTQVGSIGFTNVEAIAFAPDGTLFGVAAARPVVNQLITIDPATGAGTFVGDIVDAQGSMFTYIEGMAFSPDGVLFATDMRAYHGGPSRLLTIDTATGEGTEIGPMGFNSVVGIAFAPDGTLYGISDPSRWNAPGTGELLAIDPATGAATPVTEITEEGMESLAAAPGFVQGGCGQTLLNSVLLAQDIGPCSGPGIIMGADGITLEADGYKILGTGSGNGVEVTGKNDVTIQHLFVADFDHGIRIEGGDGNLLCTNRMDENEVGVSLSSTSNTIVRRNIVAENTVGLSAGSSGNSLFHNLIINNADQMEDAGGNTWEDPDQHLGNYWGNYWGEDTDGDFVGDTDLPHEGVDYHPLLDPVKWGEGFLGVRNSPWWVMSSYLVWRGGWSPVQIQVTDPFGQSISADENQIGMDAFYVEDQEEEPGTKLVQVLIGISPADPLVGGVYSFEMTGLEDLTYSMEWFASDQGDVLLHQSVEDIPLAGGETRNVGTKVEVDPETGEMVAKHVVALEPITAPLDPVEVGTEIQTSADFTDPGILDTYTAEWDWGDETTSSGYVVASNGSGTVTGTHTYTEPGVYTVILTVTSNNEASGMSTFEYVVVYDPDGGFVTGGGWIHSPEGAYVPDPTLTGKANFGFVSKYKKGASAPTGETEFQFKAGDLNFHSSSYQWLVVAGSKAKYKGNGTINGSGNYGIMLTATDAEVDLFRIKIWDKDAGDEVVYDNKMGKSDDSYAGTELSGGNIKIHKAKKPIAETTLPTTFALYQNAPNPFNPETTIRFDLLATESVQLSIFNLSGQLIRTLVDDMRSAGCYAVVWDGRDDDGHAVASGMFLYRLQAGNREQTRKLLLVR